MSDMDRRTRMVHSSVKAPPKKDGAGGQFTWGSVTDETNYQFVGAGTYQQVSTAQVVTVQPAMQPAVAQNFQLAGADFPTLGSGPSANLSPLMLPMTTMAAPIRWGPAPAPTPVILNPETHLRPGLGGEPSPAFDGQHPRNTFAKRPYLGAPIPVVELACSSPKDSKAKICEMTNPAHLSPYATKPATGQLSSGQLASIAAKPQFMPPPRISKQQFSTKVMREQRVIMQPQQRGSR